MAVRYRLSVAGGVVIARSTSLAFITAQARALALRGYCTFIRDSDERVVELRHRKEAFDLIHLQDPEPPWLTTCRALLSDHG